MSTVVQLGKRLRTTNSVDDSDSDLEVIEVKRSRTINKEEQAGLISQQLSTVFKFLEQSVLFKRVLKAVLSTFGIHYEYYDDSSTQEVELSEDSTDMPEENSPPLSCRLKEKSKSSISFPSTRNTNFSVRHGNLRHRDTFVTLRQSQNINNTVHKDPINVHHKNKKNLGESQYSSDLQKGILQSFEDRRSGKILKSSQSNHNNATCASHDKETIDLIKEEEEPVSPDRSRYFNDDVQILFNDRKNQPDFLSQKSLVNAHQMKKPTLFHHSESVEDTGRFQNFKTSFNSQNVRNGFCQEMSSDYTDDNSFSGRIATPAPKSNSTTNELAKIIEREQYKELLQKLCQEQQIFQTNAASKNFPGKLRSANVTLRKGSIIHKHHSYPFAKRSAIFSTRASTHTANESVLNVIDLESDEPEVLEIKASTLDSDIKSSGKVRKPVHTHYQSCLFTKSKPIPSAKTSKCVLDSSYPDVIDLEDDEPQVFQIKSTMNGDLNSSDPFARPFGNGSFSQHLRRPKSDGNNPVTLKVKANVLCKPDECYAYESAKRKKSPPLLKLSKESGDFPDVIFKGSKLHQKLKVKEQCVDKAPNQFIRKFSESSISHEPPGVCTKNAKSFITNGKDDVKCTVINDFFSDQSLAASSSGDVNITVTSEFPDDVICEGDDVSCVKPMKNYSKSQQAKSKSPMILSPEWIQDLRKTIIEETKERTKYAEDQAYQVKEYREVQAAKFAKFKSLLEEYEPSISKIQLLEKESKLPELTPEMEEVVEKTLELHSTDEIVSVISNFQILWKDIDTLSGSNWLNDEIINVYMFLIQERSKLPQYPSIYAFNSFFYSKLKSQGYQSVRRWTRKVDIFDVDIILVPLHLGVHWCLGVIDHRYKKIQYYDSMNTNENCFGVLREYLIDECLDKKKKELDMSGWVFEKMKDIPTQLNGSDCGMFTLKYADYISRNAKINFTQQHMQYFRRKMVYEIVKGRLVP